MATTDFEGQLRNLLHENKVPMNLLLVNGILELVNEHFRPSTDADAEELEKQKQQWLCELKEETFRPELVAIGHACPLCDQHVREYGRTIEWSMAESLIKLYHLSNEHPEREYFHVREDLDLSVSTSGISKLKYWGLVEEMINESTAKKNAGYWKITKAGREFARNEIKLPKYAVIYNGVVSKLTGDYVSIIQALGKMFNYEELMRTNVNHL